MNYVKHFQLYFIFLLTLLFSCRKVINVNLNSSNPRFVVVGNISDKAGPYLVSITKSVNFDQLNVAPTVSGALVIITDNSAGIADTLTETSPGNYSTHTLTGTPGHKYQLYIGTGGNTFTSSSTMPQPVSLDSLYTQKSSFRNSYSIVPEYTNDPSSGHYYYFADYKNDTETAAVYIRNGKTEVGGVISQSLNGGGGGGELNDGDIVVIDMQCIDSATFQYYNTLQQTKNQNSATPANPVSNIVGGALGYFSAHTSSVKSVVIP